MSRIAESILALHGWAALAVVFALPALEASAFVGILVPGELAVLLGGVLAFQHRVTLPAVLAAAICGAIIGDGIGYLVGRRWGCRLLAGRVGRLVGQRRLDRAQGYLARRGGPAVFFGRFTAALRALVPGLAGMAGMPYRTFAIYNAVGATLWASAVTLAGYGAGTAWRRTEQLAARASVVLLILAILAGTVIAAARWITRHPERVRAAFTRQLDRPRVAALRQRYRRQIAFLTRRLSPAGALGLWLSLGLVAITTCGWVFGAILQDVLGHEEIATDDSPVAAWLAEHRVAWLTTAMRAAALLGSGWVTVPVLLLAGLTLAPRGRRRSTVAMVLAVAAGTSLLVNTIKLLIGRARPDLAHMLVTAAGSAFPSGHAAQAAATYGAIAYLAAARGSRWRARVTGWTAAVLVVVVVGFSRLYLGAHWLTDVLGGYALGGAWLASVITATTALYRQRTTKPAPVQGQQPPSVSTRIDDSS